MYVNWKKWNFLCEKKRFHPRHHNSETKIYSMKSLTLCLGTSAEASPA